MAEWKIKSGLNYITPSLANIIATELQHPSNKAPHELLPERGFKVLCLLALGKPVVDIAALCSIEESTVSTYRTRVLTKMKMKSNSDLIHYGIVNGLVEWTIIIHHPHVIVLIETSEPRYFIFQSPLHRYACKNREYEQNVHFANWPFRNLAIN